MTTLAITNIGTLVSGDLDRGVLDADTVLCRDGKIARVGRGVDVGAADVVVDAGGVTVTPGLIDTHCHVLIGDYTPRQKTVDFLESYVHGGITSIVSAGELHAPSRPRDAAGVKALAVAIRACFLNYRPGGMRVHAGVVIIEPTLAESDFQEVAALGVRLAKYGFGAFADLLDGEPQIRWAQKYGLIVMCHSGGVSTSDSSAVTAEHLIRLRPDVCGHVNGGPTALDDDDVRRLVLETDLILQVVQAGNLRSTLEIVRLAAEHDQLHRVIVGSDSPSGSGVMPVAIMKTVCEIASLGKLAPERALALATGNNARVYELNSGLIEVGRDADLLVMDAPRGSAAGDALGAISRGDIPGISAVITDGQVRALRTRNTPLATRLAAVTPPMPWLAG